MIPTARPPRRRGAAAALLAVVVATPLGAYVAGPAAAAPGRTATLAGSLQSELGCAEDWAPPCEDTMLTPVEGTSTYSAEFTVPAGSYEFKVAMNGSWDESYGQVGSGANYPLNVGGDARLRFTFDDETKAVSVLPLDLGTDEVTAADRELAQRSLREDLTDERFYFVMADRFANGDPTNDEGGLTGDRLVTGFDPTDKGFYHGGDLAGIIEQLDYIQGLGTTAIWLTPSFKNRPVQGSGENVSAGYHGYWVTDFTQIDPHLGTNEEMAELVDLAHARGMKVFFDIITNHTADVINYAEGQYSYIPKSERPYLDAAGEPFDPADFAGTGEFPLTDPATSFPYTPVFDSEADSVVKKPAWLNDRTLYHNRGDALFNGGESDEYGDFVGLDDLMTEDPRVVDGMGDIFETWVDFGIDGFRIDTVKHVNMEFWQDFAPRMDARAAEIGNDDFFAFGEVYAADPAFMSRYTTEGRMQATIDFAFQDRAVATATGAATTKLSELFADDDWYIDADSNAYQLPTFLGNHDMGRIGKFVADSGATGQELLDRDRLAHSIMYLTRGQPVIYYGDEQGFVGDGGDKDARQDMFASQVASYNDDDLIGTDATTAVENYDTTHPLYSWIADLAALREAHPALADGAQITRYASAEAGIFAASRIDRETGREYLIAVNNSEVEATASVATYSGNSRLRTLLGSVADLRTDKEGRVDITVPPLSAVVWRADRKMTGAKETPQVLLTSPSMGAALSPAATGSGEGRAEVRASVPGNQFAEVSFASRVVGTEGWTALGTDDNAPYRVLPDVTAYSVGTLVEYRAVLRDTKGRVSAASSYATIGAPTDGSDGGAPVGGGVGSVEQPGAVSVPGSHNSEMGCAEDWNPACDQAQLGLDPSDDIWKGSYEVPAGSYEYKVALDRAWDPTNYGANGSFKGPNIAYDHSGGAVTFYYDHRTNQVQNTSEGPIVTVPGSFQSEMGCANDWAPSCMRSWLTDGDKDGIYTLATTQIPAGSYEAKVAHGLSFDENYGVDGAPNGGNIGFSAPAGGTVLFSYDISTHLLTISSGSGSGSGAAGPDLATAKAHWLDAEWLAWPADALAPGTDLRSVSWRLYSSPTGGLKVNARSIDGGDSLPLVREPAGLPADLQEEFRHLAGYVALRLDPATVRRLKASPQELLKGQLAVAAFDDAGRLLDAGGVQIPGVLDDLYAGATAADLGASWLGRGRSSRPSLALWAPTAQDVDLLLWQPGASGEPQVVDMRRDREGVWSARGEQSWQGGEYLYRVTVYAPSVGAVVVNEVTDPYSVTLTTNSARSVLVDLDAAALAPRQWATARAPVLAQPEDQSIYELQVRDFSISDPEVPAEHRGGYLAFADQGQGRQHLRSLAEAGLTTVHLLPTFDIATIEEDKAAQAVPACDLESFAPDSAEQQACIDEVRARDAFNWGYDPLHWMAPEGSYATDPNGAARVAEFRTMVGALHADGLQVVLDVVFNHTAASGQDPKSVLDRIVPGYYHRLDARTGAVETSTCCANIATEHAMAEKLMVDSLVVWARDYKVDGFRFDLMGHSSLSNMRAVRAALDELTVRRDGVDGSAIVLYGEGWNFGEVADDARFDQARQGALGGTEIATFSDRLRDAVRGGGPFDEDPRIQGLGSGLFTDPNASPANGSPEDQLARLLLAQDTVKVGLAGNLADFSFQGRDGLTTGAQVDYNGSPAGYATDPSEVITYVDAHDNETIWDALTYKLPADTAMSDRVRMNTLALSTTAFAQTPSFWHAGADLLRSKSLDRNSYDSGDWFNQIGWDGADNGFGRGLPPAADNESKWSYAGPLLADPALQPSAADVEAASAAAADLLRIRYSSPLFRLGDADEIQDRVSFPIAGRDQVPGVVVMRLDDSTGVDRDPRSEGLLVVFNASTEAATQAVPALVGEQLSLHPVQQQGVDAVVRGTTWDAATGSVTVPARTVAVLVQP